MAHAVSHHRVIPAYEDAKKDPALRDLSIVVYLHLLDQLDPVEFREVKRLHLATVLNISERAITRALDKLVTHRYLRRGKCRPGQPRTYRLVYSKLP